MPRKVSLPFLLLVAVAPLFATDYEILDRSHTVQVESISFATEHHLEIVKILSKEGADYQKILPVNSYVKIRNVRGTVSCLDGRTRPLKEEEEMAELPMSGYAGLLTDVKAIVISPSNLEPGCKVQVTYDREVSNLLYIDSWIYGSLVPIRKSTCTVSFPSNLSLKYRCTDPNVKIQKNQTGGKTTIVFESANEKEIILKGSMDSYRSVEKKVEFLPEQCMTDKWILSTTSWQNIASWFSELSKFAYGWDPSMDIVINDITARNKNPEDIAQELYSFIQKSFVYTGVEVGIGGYKPRFAAQTYQKKYGDCKDLAILYLTLLKKAGIEGYPALVDTRNSRFFLKDFPRPNQFNHCIAYLPKIRNGTWVDCTTKNFRLGEIPAVLQGKQALVVGGPNALLKIPENFSNSNVVHLSASGSYSEKGLTMKGQVDTLGEASAAVNYMQNALLKNSAQHYVYNSLLMQGTPVQKLETTLQNEHSLKLSYETPVYQAQRYRLFLVNAMNYPAKEVLSEEPQPVQFFALGTPNRLIWESNIDLSGHQLVSEPFMKEKKGKYVSYKLELSETGGKIRYVADAFFANGFLDGEEMKVYQQELREFFPHVERMLVVQ